MCARSRVIYRTRAPQQQAQQYRTAVNFGVLLRHPSLPSLQLNNTTNYNSHLSSHLNSHLNGGFVGGSTGRSRAYTNVPSNTYAASAGVGDIHVVGVKRTPVLFREISCEFPHTYPLSSVNRDVLYELTSDHPNKELVRYILNGLCYGFDIGFVGINCPTRPKNLRSAKENRDSLSEAVYKERGVAINLGNLH